MQNRFSHRAAVGVALVTLVSPAMAQSRRLTLERNEVIPVTLEDYISSTESRRGDRFTATVTSDSGMPRGTEFRGRVVDVQRKRDERPAYVELEFNEVVLPDGRRQRIRAVPVAWNDRTVRRGRDGRFIATEGVVRKEKVVGTGALAGLVIGALTKKPFEGLVWGTIAGILVAEGMADENSGREAHLRPGTRIGVLMEQTVTLNWRREDDRYWEGENYGRYDRRGDEWADRDGPYDRYDRYDDDEYDRRRIRIEYRGEELRFSSDEQPYRLGSTVMVPLERTARQLDLDVSESRNSDVIVVEDEDSMLKLEHGTREYRLNGRRGTLSREIVRREGVVYVPLEVLAEMKREPVHTNGMTLSGRR